VEKNKNILNQLKKNNKPNVPEGFFNHFTDDLMSKIESEKSILDAIKKTDKPKVPNSFFDNFAENLPIENKKKGRIIPLKTVVVFGAIAASLLLIFVLNWNSNNKQNIANNNKVIETDSIVDKSYMQKDEDEIYLAYFTEDDIVDFIIENKINIDDNDFDLSQEENEMFDELDSELDDYIYEL
jgi:hypothetical protein